MDQKKLHLGDLVEVRYIGGRLVGRIHGFKTYISNRPQVLVKPDPSCEDDIDGSTELRHYDVIGVELDTGTVPLKPWILVPAQMLYDPLTVSMRDYFKRHGLCPRCGDPGFWQIMACICPHHGPFLGV